MGSRYNPSLLRRQRHPDALPPLSQPRRCCCIGYARTISIISECDDAPAARRTGGLLGSATIGKLELLARRTNVLDFLGPFVGAARLLLLLLLLLTRRSEELAPPRFLLLQSGSTIVSSSDIERAPLW